MEGMEQIVSVPIITALVYVAMMLYKFIANGKEPFVRLIPALAVSLGIVLGALVFFITPELMPATNIFMAILIGAGSGLAATGTHQIFKQLQKMDDDLEEKKPEETKLEETELEETKLEETKLGEIKLEETKLEETELEETKLGEASTDSEEEGESFQDPRDS